MPFAVGATVLVRPFTSLAFESGLLFHRLGDVNEQYAYQGVDGNVNLHAARWRARAVEIPLLVRYSLLSEDRSWRPFVSAGAAVRRTSMDTEALQTVLSGTALPNSTRMEGESDKWNLDPVVGAGVSFRSGRLTLEPQVRYSYWGAGKHTPVRKNQVHFLFGLRF